MTVMPVRWLPTAGIALAIALPLRASESTPEPPRDQQVRDTLEAFRKAYRGPEDRRTDAVSALAAVKDRRILRTLARVLDDPDPSVRIEAVAALGGYAKDREAAGAVVRALTAARKDPAVRVACLDALGCIRDWSATAAVVDRFDDPEVRVVAAAMRAAARIRDPALVPALIDFLGDTGAGGGRPHSRMEFAVNRFLLTVAARAALQQITAEKGTRRAGRAADAYRAPRTAKDWKAWWKANEAGVSARLEREDREERERLALENRPRK